eukprot:Hpha_TRINITY_DN25399_c0_g1::TRINITY_DN25399_c0_g1_i1::g.2818::m.2818
MLRQQMGMSRAWARRQQLGLSPHSLHPGAALRQPRRQQGRLPGSRQADDERETVLSCPFFFDGWFSVAPVEPPAGFFLPMSNVTRTSAGIGGRKRQCVAPNVSLFWQFYFLFSFFLSLSNF